MNNTSSIMKKFEWKKPRGFFGWGTSPEADWKIIFFSTIVFAALATALNLFVFVKMNQGELFVAEDTGETEAYYLDMQKLKDTVSHYEAKAAEFQKWRSGASAVIVDPSI